MLASNKFTRLFSVVVLLALFSAASTQANAYTWVQISGPISASCGSTGYYSAITFGTGYVTSYSWTAVYSNGTVTGGGGPVLILNYPNSSGSVSISLSAWIRETDGSYSSRFASWSTTIGGVAPAQPGTISGISSTCSTNSTSTYSIGAVSGASSYTWEVSSPYRIVHPSTGALVTSYTGSQTAVSVRFPSSGSVSSGYVRVRSNGSGACAASSAYRSKTVKFGPQSATVSGPSSVSQWGFANFSLSGGSAISNISWTYPSGFFPMGTTTGSSIQFEIFASNGGYVRANYQSCGVSRSSSKYVSVSTGGPGTQIPRGTIEDEVIDIESLYPNPASEVVTVTSTTNLKAVYVLNLVGQTVMNVNDIAGQQATINVSDLQSGNYFVIAISEEGKKTHQLVVE